VAGSEKGGRVERLVLCGPGLSRGGPVEPVFQKIRSKNRNISSHFRRFKTQKGYIKHEKRDFIRGLSSSSVAVSKPAIKGEKSKGGTI
jgi:hypothetical protein